MPTQLLPLAYKIVGGTIALLASTEVVAVVDFTSKITLGSIITTVVIVAIAGLFTVRSKIANIWREEAEGERAAKERCHEELVEEKASRAEFDRQQQELRHDLKGQIAGLQAQLKVMEARTDLTVALEAINNMQQSTVTLHGRTHELLSEIRDKLPHEPFTVVDITPDDRPPT